MFQLNYPHTQMPSRCRTGLNIVTTTLFAAVVLFGILLAYVTGYQFIHTEQHHLSFGLYGAILAPQKNKKKVSPAKQLVISVRFQIGRAHV